VKRFSKYIYTCCLWAVLLFALSSCFELREELSIKKDGSGSFKLVADFSEHKEMLAEMLVKKDTSAQNPFQLTNLGSLVQIFDRGASEFNKIKGISNAQEIADSVNYIFGFSFDFTDVSALNLALVMKDAGDFNTDFKLPYRYEGKGKLVKNDVFVFKKMFKDLLVEQKDLPEYLQSQKKAIFAQISYKCIISTEGKIKKVSNSSYNMAEGKYKLVYQAYLREIYDGIVDISTELKFK